MVKKEKDFKMIWYVHIWLKKFTLKIDVSFLLEREEL